MASKDGTKIITNVTMRTEVRTILEEWSRLNMTSLSAEISRSIRERHEREKVAAAA